MMQRSSSTWNTKPHKAIFYSPVSWFVDWRAGCRDGYAAIPDVPSWSAETADPRAATTPFIEVRRRHFLDRSEREQRHMLNDLEPAHRQLAALRQDIVGGQAKVVEYRERLSAIPEALDETELTRRNAVEQDIHDELVRARRQREHDARRARVLADLERAVAEVRTMRVEEARLERMITSREQILATRVRQLHEHTLRRCATYKHHLVRKHPDGNALVGFLNLALPTLPFWLPRQAPRTRPTDFPATQPTPIAPFINRKEAR
jgi:hypothetical protein